MNKTAWTILIIVIVVVVAGGIYWSTTQNMSASSTTAPTVSNSAPTLSLGSNAQFSSYLAAANGMALYTFNGDTAGVSNCSGSCAAAWPPYTVSSASGLSAGANIPGALGTITRSDGTLQVTYNGLPLYFFAQDSSVGQVTGDGENGFSIAMAAAGQAAAPATTKPQTPAPSPTPTPSPTPAPAPSPAPAPYSPPYNY